MAVHTWANGFGIWHARVSRTAISPLIAARRALREELQARESNVARYIWMFPVRVPDLDDSTTIVYRERNNEMDNQIPQDFLDIDSNEDHWVMTGVSGPNEGRRFPDPDLWCVPSVNADGDMTEAMMSEIPGWDDTVEPLKLEEKRGYKFMMAFLMQDGNLGVPGGRYGSDTRNCAEIAIIHSLLFQYHNGEPVSYYSLNSDMSSVVNSSDGVASLLSESQYICDENKWGVNVKELLGDQYEPQTMVEKLVYFINEQVPWTDANEDSDGGVTINCIDEDGAEALYKLIKQDGNDE